MRWRILLFLIGALLIGAAVVAVFSFGYPRAPLTWSNLAIVVCAGIAIRDGIDCFKVAMKR